MAPVKNLILIVVDTLRCDALGCYGGGGMRARTPNLDALAARSSVFDRFYAASFPTVPARQVYLLGRWTFATLTWEPLPWQEKPVSQILTAAGVRTAALGDNPHMFRIGGYERGFQHFLGQPPKGPGARRGRFLPPTYASEYDHGVARIVVTAEQWLEQLYKERFFLWLDTFQPHEPWHPPSWYVHPYKPDYDGRTVAPPYDYYQQAGLAAEDLATARACYMGEVSMLDRWIGRLLERLESLGIAEQTAVIVASDHGFSFGEHGGLFGKWIWLQASASPTGRRAFLRSPLYEEVAHIPLLVYLPGMPPRRVPQLTSAVDLMPTILDVLGVPPPAGLTIDGRSLLPLLQDGAALGRECVVTSFPLSLATPNESVSARWLVMEYSPATITTAEWSLLYAARGEPVELYHLPTDPGQTRNVAAQHRGVVEELHAAYVRLLEQAGARDEYLIARRRL